MQNKELPLVSIITPSYNQGQYIEETIKSVLSQDYPNIEYIVMDGGSTDNTLNILRKYSNRIKWISEPDNGQSDAINKGFKMSRGEIIAWLNSDDTYCPGAIKGGVESFIKNSDIAMTYGDGYEVDDRCNVIIKFPYSQKFDFWKLIYVLDYILQPTVFMKRKAVFEVGLLDTSMSWCFDWDLWIKLGKKHRILYVPKLVANARVYSTTKTSSGGFGRFREIVQVMRKHGKKKFPPGFFVYGADTLKSVAKERLPLLYCLIPKDQLLGLRFLFSKTIYTGQGVSQDNWITKRAYFTVPVQGGDTLVIKGMVPFLDEMLPLKVEIEINKKEKKVVTIEEKGLFCIKYKLKSSKKDLIDIIVRSNKAFKPCNNVINNDKRKISFLLKDIYVKKAG